MRILVGAVLGTLGLAIGSACGSSSSTPSGTHQSSSSGGSGGGSSGGGEFDAAGPRTIVGFTGVTMCGEPVDAGWMQWSQCAISMPLSGGLSGYLDVPNLVVICGSGSTGSTGIGEIDWGTNAGNDTSVTVTATFTNPLPLDTTGSFPATLEIAVRPLDAGRSAWQTPAGACSIDIAGSMCVEPHSTGPDGGPRQERILSGTGTCSQPAAPESGTSGLAVTIGTFQFLETIGP